jgi:pimeloyl-ACP methyl ester carboxylesterase
VWDFPPLGPLFARLGEIARCVVFDKRGTGLSERDLGFGSLEQRAEDIRAVMDAAGLARASLFAFSESAALAVVFAAAHPDRVDRLILYSSYARLVAAPGYEGGFPPELVDAFVDRIRSDWGSGNPSRISFQGIPADDDAARRLGRWERSVCTPTMAAHIIRSNADIDVRSLLPGVMAPTLVLHSTGDPVTPAALGRYVADHVPRASYVEQDAGYHLPWDGGTAWFVDAIAAFLAAAVPDAEPSHTFLSTVLYARGGAPGESGRGGEVVHSAEGEFAAIFDSPSRAIARALELSRGGASVAVHTGELERTGHTVSGTAIELAAAVAQVAESGEVLVTSSVRDLTAGSGLSFTERTAADGSALFVVSD